jgi:hypothetical protein
MNVILNLKEIIKVFLGFLCFFLPFTKSHSILPKNFEQRSKKMAWPNKQKSECQNAET